MAELRPPADSCNTVASAYRVAGAEVFNIPEVESQESFFDQLPPGPASELIDFWLAHVRGANHD